MTEIQPLENVFVIIGISRPIPAKMIGVDKYGSHKFEHLKSNFDSFKNGARVIYVRNFDICDIKIQGKKIIVVK